MNLKEKFKGKGALWTTAYLCALMTFILTGWIVPAAAGDKSPPNPSRSREQIQITADQLITHADENFAEFLGNVEAVQGNFELQSDKLKIFYRKGTGIGGSAAPGEEALEKIVASGNVKIKSDNQHAVTEAAEYDVASGLLVLTGENTILADGNNSIRGSKISLNRFTGEIRVESSEKSRVRAIVYSARGINPSSGTKAKGSPIQKDIDSDY